MKRLLAGFMIACGLAACTPPKPPVVGPYDLSVVVTSKDVRLQGATVTIDGASPMITNENGYVDTMLPANSEHDVTATKEGYTTVTQHVKMTRPYRLLFGIDSLKPPMPTRDEMRQWKGDFCGVPYPAPIGPKFVYTPMYPVFDKATRDGMRAAFKAKGYTHWPLNIAGGYKDVYPRFNYYDRPEEFRVFLKELWDDGIIPVVFLLDDQGPHTAGYIQHFVDVNRDLLKITSIGWELNDWMTPAEATQAAKDLRKMLGPEPLLYVHMTPQHGAMCNTDGCEPAWWRSMHGIVTGNLYQEFPGTDIPHFQQNLKDFVLRLSGGYWGITDMDVVAYEYACFYKFHGTQPEQYGIDRGVAAMQVPGVKGFGDGGKP